MDGTSPDLNPNARPYNSLRRKKARSFLNASSEELNPHIDQFRNEIPASTNNEYQGWGRPSVYAFSHDALDTEAAPEGHLRSARPSSINLPEPKPTFDEPVHDDFIQIRASQSRLRNLFWPALIICLPMVLLSAGILYVVFYHHIKTAANIFDAQVGGSPLHDSKYLLVNFSATKLVFLASFLSTIAPLTAGSIMTVTAMVVYQKLKKVSSVGHFPQLPTPYQTSLLIGSLAASYEEFFSGLAYLLSSKRTAKASPVLLYTLSMFGLTILLSLGVTITDAYLHVATQTIPITIYNSAALPSEDLGKGLNAYCLGIDRVKDNNGYPCSFPSNTKIGQNPEWLQGQPEIALLAHNTSVNSTMYLAHVDDVEGFKIAFLMPRLTPDQINFQATTIGVSSRCSLIPPKACNTTQWGPQGYYTSFNCSSQFWGTLGYPPAQATPGSLGKPLSQYLSFLAINQNSNLIYNYFADSALEVVYNPSDLNASAMGSNASSPWPDSQLVNPAQMAFAWRSSKQTFAGATRNGMVLSDLVQVFKGNNYVDYFLKCSVASYDVNYTWVNGSLHAISTSLHGNGTIIDIWTGLAKYIPSISATDSNWQQYNIQSMIAGNTTDAYEARFSELISQDALAAIGAYTSPRRVLQQQQQRNLLVAKVPKAALGALLGCSLLYPILGIWLLMKAWNAVKRDGPVSPLFSYWGLTSAAFLDQPRELGAFDAQQKPRNARDQEEALRLYIRNDTNRGDHFAVWRRSRAGHITELQRSQGELANWF